MRIVAIRSLIIRSLAMTNQRLFQAACSALTVTSFAVVCASSAGLVRQLAGLSLISALALATWFRFRQRFGAIVPAVGLTLVFLILAGLALAAVRALTTVPVALTLAVASLAAVWVGDLRPSPGLAQRRARHRPPNPLAVTGVLIFAAASVLAVHFSAASAAAGADGASSVAIWAYPSGDQLRVGVQQPAGHGPALLRIVVTQAGVTVATWNNIRLAPGQTWEAPALTVTGNGAAQVVVLSGRTVVASLSSR